MASLNSWQALRVSADQIKIAERSTRQTHGQHSRSSFIRRIRRWDEYDDAEQLEADSPSHTAYMLHTRAAFSSLGIEVSTGGEEVEIEEEEEEGSSFETSGCDREYYQSTTEDVDLTLFNSPEESKLPHAVPPPSSELLQLMYNYLLAARTKVARRQNKRAVRRTTGRSARILRERRALTLTPSWARVRTISFNAMKQLRPFPFRWDREEGREGGEAKAKAKARQEGGGKKRKVG